MTIEDAIEWIESHELIFNLPFLVAPTLTHTGGTTGRIPELL